MASYLPHQYRVIKFKAHIDENLSRLRLFLGSPKAADVAEAELSRLKEQADLLYQLSDVLQRRIESFTDGKPVAARQMHTPQTPGEDSTPGKGILTHSEVQKVEALLVPPPSEPAPLTLERIGQIHAIQRRPNGIIEGAAMGYTPCWGLFSVSQDILFDLPAEQWRSALVAVEDGSKSMPPPYLRIWCEVL